MPIPESHSNEASLATQPPTHASPTSAGQFQDDCCAATTTANPDPGWLRGARRAKRLSWFSLAWMTGEGILGLTAGLAANSISLIGWALGSVIEGLASIIVIWRFTGGRTLSEGAELRAGRAVAL